MATFLQPGGVSLPQADPDSGGGPLLSLPDLAALAQAPTTAANPPIAQDRPLPAGADQVWNLPAKLATANQVYHEELARIRGHNNSGDAMRHAEASRRLAAAAGPVFTTAVGLGHEIVDSLPSFVPGGHSQPISEAVMDMMNNSRGIDAAIQGVPIDPSKLQTKPMSLTAAYAKANQAYQNMSPDTGAYSISPGGSAGDPQGYAGAVAYDPESRFPPY